MGYQENTTPTLDRLAENGLVFERAVSPGVATPGSMPAIFTGNSDFHGRSAIADHMGRMRSIPERLSDHGYTTIGVTPNPFTSRHYGFDVGFDRFRDFLTDNNKFSLRQKVVSRWVGGEFVAGLRFGLNMIGRGDISIDWEDYYPWMLEKIESVSEPFFLWVFLLEPHWPYRPPKRFRDGISLRQMYYHNWKQSNLSDTDPDDPEILLRLYDGTIRYVDEFIDRISSDLSEYDPTFVFHADHGEAFGEHSEYGHSDLYQENIHVPLLIAGIPERGRVEEPVSLKQLPDMIDAIRRNASHELFDYGDAHVLSGNSNNYAIRGKDWKYINRDGQELVYDLDSDPDEREPVVAEETVSNMCRQLARGKRADDRERRLITQAAKTFDNV